ncbi:hypothetical protein JI667_21705, partial [Bacillus sp. NTK074B]|nr:hypothetical protein [Bacillus sp. NTK074B]
FGGVVMVIVAAVLQRRVIGQPMLFEPLRAHDLLVHGLVETGKDGDPVTGLVIDRDVPLGDRHLARHGDADRLGEDLIGDTDMGMTVF